MPTQGLNSAGTGPRRVEGRLGGCTLRGRAAGIRGIGGLDSENPRREFFASSRLMLRDGARGVATKARRKRAKSFGERCAFPMEPGNGPSPSRGTMRGWPKAKSPPLHRTQPDGAMQ